MTWFSEISNAKVLEIFPVLGIGRCSENNQRNSRKHIIFPDQVHGFFTIHARHVYVHDDQAWQHFIHFAIGKIIEPRFSIGYLDNFKNRIKRKYGFPDKHQVIQVIVNTQHGSSRTHPCKNIAFSNFLNR